MCTLILQKLNQLKSLQLQSYSHFKIVPLLCSLLSVNEMKGLGILIFKQFKKPFPQEYYSKLRDRTVAYINVDISVFGEVDIFLNANFYGTI